MTLEKVLMMRDPRRFIEEVNRELDAGWTVKPGTWDVKTLQKVPTERTPAHTIKDGLSVDQCYFVTLIAPAAS